LPGREPGDDLEALIRRVDPDRWLTTRFIADPAARADVAALYVFAYELARARRVAATPLTAEIRLAWWREAVDEMFGAGPVRRHPTAEALAAAVRRRLLPREPLEAMIEGEIAALEPEALDAAAAERWAEDVHGSAARLAAMILDPAAPGEAAAPAGRAFGLSLLIRSRRVDTPAARPLLRSALAEARRAAPGLGVAAFPAALPARLARGDLAARPPGGLAKRLALVLAVATGRV